MKLRGTFQVRVGNRVFTIPDFGQFAAPDFDHDEGEDLAQFLTNLLRWGAEDVRRLQMPNVTIDWWPEP